MFGAYYTGQFYLGQSGGFTVDSRLYVDSSTVDSQSTNLVLYQKHIISIDSTTVASLSDGPAIIERFILDVMNSSVSSLSDSITLSQKHNLVISDAVVSSQSGSIILEVFYNLVADDSAVLSQSGNITLNEFKLLNKPDDAIVTSVSDVIRLIQNHTLEIEDSLVLVTDSGTRIIDWVQYNRFFGNYGEDRPDTGELGTTSPDYGVIGVDKAGEGLGLFAVYIYALLLVETGEYAMGEDGCLLMPEQKPLNGYFKETNIAIGTYE